MNKMLGNRIVNNILGVRIKYDKKSKNYLYQTREERRKSNEQERERIKNEDILNTPQNHLNNNKFKGYNITGNISKYDEKSSVSDSEIKSIIQKANIYDSKKENALYLEQYKKKYLKQ